MYELIDQLVLQGVVDFFLAPGSRSTPLAVAASRHPHVRIHRHFDERGLGFFALGQALGSERASAIITTSGTAVGNLLPSVMEAHHSSIPLILLTADRPSELRECSANQTTDQVKIFQNFVRFQFDLDPKIPIKAIRSKAAEAVFYAQTIHPGPVHINCPLREPLYPIPSSESTGQPIHLQRGLFAPLKEQELPAKGLILLGRLPNQSEVKAVLKLAEKLQWPVFADLLSSARIIHSAEQIRHFDYCFDRAPHVDCVLHFGERFTSKRLIEYLSAKPPSTYLHISSERHWNDPFQLITGRIFGTADSVSFFAKTDPSWLKKWQELDKTIHMHHEREAFPFTESSWMREISQMPLDEWGIFLANSMPIREAEWFLFPHKVRGFFGNRGLAGIDGNLATIAGLSIGLNGPILGIVGDVTALHDLNSLSLIEHLPVVLIISNNDGCGIFSHLAVSSDPEFEKLWGFPHGYSFEKAANMFRIPYTLLNSQEDFASCLKNAIQERKPHILEVTTSRKENHLFHQRLRQCLPAQS